MSKIHAHFRVLNRSEIDYSIHVFEESLVLTTHVGMYTLCLVVI